jgi:hypothetical protein
MVLPVSRVTFAINCGPTGKTTTYEGFGPHTSEPFSRSKQGTAANPTKGTGPTTDKPLVAPTATSISVQNSGPVTDRRPTIDKQVTATIHGPATDRTQGTGPGSPTGPTSTPAQDCGPVTAKQVSAAVRGPGTCPTSDGDDGRSVVLRGPNTRTDQGTGPTESIAGTIHDIREPYTGPLKDTSEPVVGATPSIRGTTTASIRDTF